MKPQRIYLETTIFNRYFDVEYKEAHKATRKLFDEIKAGKFEAFTSDYAYDEIKKSPEPKRSNMLALIGKYGITQLSGSDEADVLAEEYIKKEIIPPSSMLDAQHVACASINGIECIVSVNFSHINRRKTKELVPPINKLNGYNSGITINTPMEIVENEE